MTKSVYRRSVLNGAFIIIVVELRSMYAEREKRMIAAVAEEANDQKSKVEWRAFNPHFRCLPKDIFNQDRSIVLADYRSWYGLVACPETGDPVFVTLWGNQKAGYYWIPPEGIELAHLCRQPETIKAQTTVASWLRSMLGADVKTVRVPRSNEECFRLLRDALAYQA